jgi:integration host factor subunit beta
MTQAELVDKVAATLQLPKHQTATVVHLFWQCIMDALGEGDHVALRGFGSFRLHHRRPRAARNPRTGATVQVPAKQVPWFTRGKVLHALLNPQVPSRRAQASVPRPSPAAAGRDARGHTARVSQ